MGNTQPNMCVHTASDAVATAQTEKGGKINEIHSQ